MHTGNAKLIGRLAGATAILLIAGCQGPSSGAPQEGGGAARAAGDAMQSAGAAASADEGPPEGLTWIAVRDINRVYDDDMNPTNRPPLVDEAPEGMITAVDISPDGQADWLLDYTEAGSTQWCGSGGCRHRLFVSTPDGLAQVFDANANTVEAGGEGRVRVSVHHMYCEAAAGQDDCEIEMAYDGAAHRLVVVSGPDDFNPMGWSRSER